MGKVKEILEGLPYFMKPGIINLAEKRIKFENGCSIKCAAASKSPATGDSIQLLYIDEAALIPENVIEEYWASIIPTMSSFSNSQIILSSTPRGKGNRFFKVVDGAINGDNDFYYQRVDWWEVPGHDEEWAKRQKALLGEELFNREFGLSFETAGSRIVSDHSVLFMNRIAQKFVIRDFYSVPEEISKCIKWAPDFDPTFMSYQDLKNRKFLLSVDTAQGILAGTTSKKDADYNIINIFEIEPMSPYKIEENRNNSPITIMDCIQYKQVGIYMDNIRDEAQCAEAAKYIVFQILKCGLKDIDNCRVLLEINFNGNNWITKFKNHPSYYDLIILKTVKGIQKPGQKIEQMKQQYGYRTTGGSHGKNYYCELGASMIHKRQIIPRQIDNDNVNISTVTQLQQFAKNDKGHYEGTCCHDDISITTLFVSIAQESKQFRLWITDWMEHLNTRKSIKIMEMLNIYIEQEAQISQEAFHNFYQAASSTFGKLTYKQNGYGSIMDGNIPNNNNGYINGGSYSSGSYNSYGNMNYKNSGW
ncbi:MAG: terminase large subunit [Wendovervirus sonii]|uniref:Terminase large subunit n=1 Tax=phage Lak_Megaphage_Sonny TaxID=3109229 RepID=A0ABZ0Z341_9CAUD|nr:MAG: terminase large subunit [phage Lak_Megaphage_Sonny]